MMQKKLHMLIFCCVFLLGTLIQAQDETPLFVYEFPMPTITSNQLESANQCDLSEENVDTSSNTLVTDSEDDLCEMMQQALNAVRTSQDDNSVPQEALELYHQVVEQNPAYIYRFEVYMNFLSDVGHLVSPPEITQNQLESVSIEYYFGGGATDYTINLTRASETFEAQGNVLHSIFSYEEEIPKQEYDVNEEVDLEIVDALATSLRNLVPTTQFFTDQPCWHILPNWNVTLTFEDEQSITLTNNRSNLFYAGGPWQMSIDEQYYVQVDASFLIALIDVTNSLELPYGEVASFGCGTASGIMDYIAISEEA